MLVLPDITDRMAGQQLLDDLSGFEFEDLMEDVFRNLGYENVRQAARVADKGRDIIMEEVVDGTRQTVIVECKHTATVSRPVVQKLHSAVATYSFDGPKRGIVVTTGRFTGPAEEYANKLQESDSQHPIELIDGRDLRRIAEQVGLDLYNGRIEIICEETLWPMDPTTKLSAPLKEQFRPINNVSTDDLPVPETSVEFQPVIVITADIDATFETSVGVIHSIDETERVVVSALWGHPELLNREQRELILQNRRHTTTLDEQQFDELFDTVEIKRFGQTETEYKDWAIDRFQENYTTTVTYTGDNNVTYNKTCEPGQSEITIQSITPLYLPRVRQTVATGEYTHTYEYDAAGPSRSTIKDQIKRCVHCETDTSDETYTYCDNCGSISCTDHIETERLKQTPVCHGCAVTGRFALKTKYFYNDENREQFRKQYDQMPIHQKLLENPALAVIIVMFMALLVAGGLTAAGIV